MRTGWEIVIAGRDFDPTDFFSHSTIQPCRIWKREMQDAGARFQQRVIEFTDWQEGPSSLDLPTEALDYLETHRSEFEELCSLPGIEERCLNFVDSLDHHGGSFDFNPSWISTLASLGLSISICVVPHGGSKALS